MAKSRQIKNHALHQNQSQRVKRSMQKHAKSHANGRQTKNQALYQKEIKRIKRSMRRYAKQGYEFGSMESYFTAPKRITRKAIQELQRYKGKSIRDLAINSTNDKENIPTFRDLAVVQIDNLYAEFDNFPSEIRSFLVQQFDRMIEQAGLNAIEENDLDVDTSDLSLVREIGKEYLAPILQKKQSFIYYIQNSGYDSWQAIREFCSDVVNELKNIGVLGSSEADELDDMFEMQLGMYEGQANIRKAQRKSERDKVRRELKKKLREGTKYKNGERVYSPQQIAERMNELKQEDMQRIAKMSNEEFNKFKKRGLRFDD